MSREILWLIAVLLQPVLQVLLPALVPRVLQLRMLPGTQSLVLHSVLYELFVPLFNLLLLFGHWCTATVATIVLTFLQYLLQFFLKHHSDLTF